MSTTFEIPLIASPQKFSIAMGGVTYIARVLWNEKSNCWVLDLLDLNGNEILTGTPLVTGADLFEQFEYLEFGGQLIVQTDHNPDAVPTFFNLGTSGHLFYITP